MFFRSDTSKLRISKDGRTLNTHIAEPAPDVIDYALYTLPFLPLYIIQKQ